MASMPLDGVFQRSPADSPPAAWPPSAAAQAGGEHFDRHLRGADRQSQPSPIETDDSQKRSDEAPAEETDPVSAAAAAPDGTQAASHEPASNEPAARQAADDPPTDADADEQQSSAGDGAEALPVAPPDARQQVAEADASKVMGEPPDPVGLQRADEPSLPANEAQQIPSPADGSGQNQDAEGEEKLSVQETKDNETLQGRLRPESTPRQRGAVVRQTTASDDASAEPGRATAENLPAASGEPAQAGASEQAKGQERREDGELRVGAVAAATRRSAASPPNQAASTTPDLAASDGEGQTADKSPTSDAASPLAANPASSSVGSHAAPSSAARLSRLWTSRGDSDAAKEANVERADQSRFLQRVAQAFQAARDHGGELRLRLSPPELGSLKLSVKVESGVLTARIEAETSMARSMLLDNLQVLRERLAEQGVRVEQFDVHLGGRGSGAPADGRSEDHGRQPDAPPPTLDAAAAADGEERDEESSLAWLRGRRDGRLNVIV